MSKHFTAEDVAVIEDLLDSLRALESKSMEAKKKLERVPSFLAELKKKGYGEDRHARWMTKPLFADEADTITKCLLELAVLCKGLSGSFLTSGKINAAIKVLQAVPPKKE